MFFYTNIPFIFRNQTLGNSRESHSEIKLGLVFQETMLTFNLYKLFSKPDHLGSDREESQNDSLLLLLGLDGNT